jgi:hypothetical protein
MRLLIVALIAAVLLSACGGDAEPTATRAPAPVPTSSPSAQPTDQPAEPTAQPIQATEAPASPTETARPTSPAQPTDTTTIAATGTPAPTQTSAPLAEGRVTFRNKLAVADQLVLTMQGITPPPAGLVYEGWLIADDGVTEISSGVFEVGTDGSVNYTWTSPSGENLIAEYTSFAITLEPADDSDPGPSSDMAFRGAADPDVLAAARRVFAANSGEPATPRNVAYGQGLLTQSQVAKDHIFNAFNAAAIGAYAEMRVHAEHVINIIEGTAGPRYADYNGDGRAENPGDGFGTLAYARQMAMLLPGASADLSAIEELLVAIQDKAEEIAASSDIASAQHYLDEFKALGEQLVNQAAPAFYGAAQTAVSFPIEPMP